MKRILFIPFLIVAIALSEAAATPHCQPCPYSCSDLGLGHKDCSVVSSAGGICCLDLTKKGLEIAAARAAVSKPAAPQAGHGCPPGFRPGGKCSPAQRKRGCKDLRGSNGESCNNL